MVRRYKKKSGKYRGHANHGKGDTKNKRGKGYRGGVGRAGMQKHRWTYVTKYEKDYYGAHGFTSPTSKRVDTVNLWEIEQRAQKNELEKKEGKLEFQFDGKVLGCGIISSPVIVKAHSASKKAIEKIEKSGGEFKQIGKES